IFKVLILKIEKNLKIRLLGISNFFLNELYTFTNDLLIYDDNNKKYFIFYLVLFFSKIFIVFIDFFTKFMKLIFIVFSIIFILLLFNIL
ncbi:MAG: hypothetical protein ACP5RD_08120, partial [bacterium]